MELLHFETKIIGKNFDVEVQMRCGSTKLISKSIDSNIPNLNEEIANQVKFLVLKILRERSDKIEAIA